MKKQEEPKPLRSKDVNLEEARHEKKLAINQKVDCKYNSGVICRAWQFDSARCIRCGWGPRNNATPAAESGA